MQIRWTTGSSWHREKNGDAFLRRKRNGMVWWRKEQRRLVVLVVLPNQPHASSFVAAISQYERVQQMM